MKNNMVRIYVFTDDNDLPYKLINYNIYYKDLIRDKKYYIVTIDYDDYKRLKRRYNCEIIRYYGLYRKKHSIHSKMIPLIKQHCRKFRKQLLKYEVSISLAFNRNPYNCPKCDTKMNFVLCIN